MLSIIFTPVVLEFVEKLIWYIVGQLIFVPLYKVLTKFYKRYGGPIERQIMRHVHERHDRDPRTCKAGGCHIIPPQRHRIS